MLFTILGSIEPVKWMSHVCRQLSSGCYLRLFCCPPAVVNPRLKPLCRRLARLQGGFLLEPQHNMMQMGRLRE